MNTASRQKINRETVDLNCTLNQMKLTASDTFYQTTAECAFFLGTHGTFYRIDPMRGHKRNLSKFKKIEIIPNPDTLQEKMLRAYIPDEHRSEKSQQILANRIQSTLKMS